MTVRFELDTEVGALYIYFRSEAIPAGGVARTIELEKGVNLDVGRDGRTLGLEFVDASDFYRFIDSHGGEIDIPDRARDIKGLSPA